MSTVNAAGIQLENSVQGAETAVTGSGHVGRLMSSTATIQLHGLF